MASIFIVFLGIIIFLLGVLLIKTFSAKISFFATGLDSKFNLSEISTLWKLAKTVDLEEPESLFISVAALTKCISLLIEKARADGTENDASVQIFLGKLYKFRTSIELASDKKRGLESSRALDNGQKLRLILKGNGIFATKILSNAREIIIPVPIQDGRIKIQGPDWVGKEVSVYLWRKGDAAYVFDTRVLSSGIFLGTNVIYLAHSDNLFRTQKRKSIRSECKLVAQLYVIREKQIDFSKVETSPGYKCLIEDISSDGAMVRIGGKGVPNIHMKLQFELEENLIIMYGIIRSVEYNEGMNQSRLHFECIHIEPSMRNNILSFVYKILPEDQKEAEEALRELEDAETEEEKAENEKKDVSKTEPDSLKIEIPTAIDTEALGLEPKPEDTPEPAKE